MENSGRARVPAIAWWLGTIAPGRRNAEIVGSLDFMATFASLVGIELPGEARDGIPMIFYSFDQSGQLKGTGPSTWDHWLYMTEMELIPGAVRVGECNAIWNIRPGWKGAEEYTAVAQELHDRWADLRERHDPIMTGLGGEDLQAPQMGAHALAVVPRYQKHPNPMLQTAAPNWRHVRCRRRTGPVGRA